MIQDIGEHRLYNEYILRQAKENDRVMVFAEDKVLIRGSDELIFPQVSELPDIPLQYLFKVDEEYFYLAREKLEESADMHYVGLRQIRVNDLPPRAYAFAVYTAYHLSHWYEHNQYCGCCGSKMTADHQERAMRCLVCNNVVYPRINPAVIVGVINNEQILLTRYRNGYGGNALIAGFTEIGETLEETVRREVREEAGLEVTNIRYYGSQPWGSAQDILAGFYCDVIGDDQIRMDENELRYASWVSRADIVLQESDYSLTNEMMKRFKEGKKC